MTESTVSPPRRTPARSARSLASEAAFRRRLEQLGAELLEPAWLGVAKKHRVRCAAGHECTPRPCGVLRGDGVCRVCVGHDPATAEADFRRRLAEAGAELLEPGWLGCRNKHRIRCAAGHICHQRPSSMQQGIGVCRICSVRCAETAEVAFRSRVAALGGECLYETWRGVNQPHHVRCPQGHDCYPRPNSVQQGVGICRGCAGKDPVVAEATYRELIRSLGGTPMWERWEGGQAPTHVMCPAGHDAFPRPNSVTSGSGMCRICARMVWDAFYIVTSESIVKFGVTSGDPRPRLRKHSRQGLLNVARITTGLSGTVALDAERAVKAALALAGAHPVRGREYFDISCLGLVLDVASGWLGGAVT